MICPKCKSENVTIELVQTGAETKKHGNGVGGHINNAMRATMAVSTLGISNLFWKKSKGNETMKTVNQKICLCRSCGYTWPLGKVKKGKF